MSKAKKLPSGRWRAQVFVSRDDNGKQHFKSFTADTKSEAERMAAQWKYGQHQDVPDITVTKAVEDYINSKRAVLSPATIREYTGMYNRYVKGSALDSLKLKAVTNLKLQNWVSGLADKVSAKTVSNAYGLVSATLQQQIPDKSFRVTLPTKDHPLLNTPTEDDIRNLMSHAGEGLKMAILLSVGGTGALRRGEVCAVKYKDLDRKNYRIFIHADLVRDENRKWVYKPHPKTSSSNRYVNYSPEVFEKIPEGDPDSYVVGLMPDSITLEFVRLRDRLGINCRFHDLRAYSASAMLAMGIPMRYVEQSGGWTPGSTALRKIYSRVLPEKESEYRKKATDDFKKFLD